MAEFESTTAGSIRLWTDDTSHRNILCESCGQHATYMPKFPELVALKTQRPIVSTPLDEEEHRVLQFRPRTVASASPQRGIAGQPVRKLEVANDLSRYERNREEPDDFRHRMLANVAAFAFTLALLAIGIWLAVSIAHLRRTQDCVLMGRRDCVQIFPPPHP